METLPKQQIAAEESTGTLHRSKRRPGVPWRLLAAGSALLLILLTVAGVYLVTRRPSTVDYLVILTVPSGADIKLNNKDYGHSPVKLEQVEKGNYTLTITKEGFEPIVNEINIAESQPLEFKLTPVKPKEALGLSREEEIEYYKQQAQQAFNRGVYGLNEEGALYYVDSILGFDPANQFAVDMRENIRQALHKSAQTALARGDFAQAQDTYTLLLDYYPHDEEAKAAAARLESQLASRRGEVRGLVRKAEDALQANDLIDPPRESAYYYSKQALAIDRQNSQARAVRNKVKDKLTATVNQIISRGDEAAAIKQLQRIIQLFPEEKQFRSQLRQIEESKSEEVARTNDPNSRRIEGLNKYRHLDYAEAIPDLEYAVVNGRSTPDVIFALARSYMSIGRLDEAASYFRKVPKVVGDEYRSSIASLGDIAMARGNNAAALDHYKEARQLGGSVLYPIGTLDDKIERIEKQQREKAAEPTPVTIQVKHLHGGVFGGSCRGTLTVNSTGVRYDGSEHVFSANFVGVSVRTSKDEMSIQFQNKTEKFKTTRSDAERFKEALAKYQGTVSINR